MSRPSSRRRRRALLFLVSQCITLFSSILVQMTIVWHVPLEPPTAAWAAAFTVRSPLSPLRLRKPMTKCSCTVEKHKAKQG
ncbi:hypothetical protein NE626_08195 [Intestinimonas massiliensis]|uniref:hypothetical protein n=1 Tax=Intestinimonas massiliensis (ex Afouda et al. 2020) TaxID=1673721 RepID=UPI00210D23C7|nr:hypothetical protein [Intestinimonas massiliensis (ex Afouda et al. 2020)]MCQ4806801.1 hypothetical protein [Intestinimonas massiliensis (ex Afouda et al. 2020)]